MILENIAGVARPVRMVANSSLANSIARSIFSSASKSVSSITCSVASFGRCVAGHAVTGGSSGGDQGADLVTTDRLDDRVLALRTEDEHRKAIVLAQAERRGVGHTQAFAEHLVECSRVQLDRGGVDPRVGGVDAVH